MDEGGVVKGRVEFNAFNAGTVLEGDWECIWELELREGEAGLDRGITMLKFVREHHVRK